MYRTSSSSSYRSVSPEVWDEERGANYGYEYSSKKAPTVLLSKRVKSFLALFIFALVTYSFLFWMEAGLGSTSLVEDLTHHTIHGKDLYTVVINTFKRPDMLRDAVNHYSQCSKVKYIHVVWSEQEPPSATVSAEYAARKQPEIFIDKHDVDSLNNRFKPLQGPHTDGIFAVDDDMRVPCPELDFAFDVWRGSKHSLVGFMPRVHHKNPSGKLTYRAWWHVWWVGSYSIILTKAAFVHHDYFDMYTNQLPKSVHTYVDESRNCEDIAMQFLVSNVTGMPPVFVKGHLNDLGVLGGISTSQNVVTASHMDERSECLNKLVGVFGRNPLVKSHVIVDSVTNRWANAPSTWFEYISSDLWNFNSYS